jgi:hypothetical protein
LAEQTAKATDEIRKQIGDIQSATQDSVHAIEEIGVTIGRISEISSTIAGGRRRAGSGYAGGRAECPAGGSGYPAGGFKHIRRAARRRRNRVSIVAGVEFGTVAFA